MDRDAVLPVLRTLQRSSPSLSVSGSTSEAPVSFWRRPERTRSSQLAFTSCPGMDSWRFGGGGGSASAGPATPSAARPDTSTSKPRYHKALRTRADRKAPCERPAAKPASGQGLVHGRGICQQRILGRPSAILQLQAAAAEGAKRAEGPGREGGGRGQGGQPWPKNYLKIACLNLTLIIITIRSWSS